MLLWDGGNNDFPFLRPGLHVVLADALRPGDVDTHHPGEAVARMADVVVVTKVDAAGGAQVEAAESALRRVAPGVPILRAASPVVLDDPAAVRGRRVVVVDDGPTLTHGGMAYGAGFVARGGRRRRRDRRPAPRCRAGDPRRASSAYPHLGRVVPALGYSEAQRRALEATLDAAPRT